MCVCVCADVCVHHWVGFRAARSTQRKGKRAGKHTASLPLRSNNRRKAAPVMHICLSVVNSRGLEGSHGVTCGGRGGDGDDDDDGW
jgi:hypothetical protein